MLAYSYKLSTWRTRKDDFEFYSSVWVVLKKSVLKKKNQDQQNDSAERHMLLKPET